VTSLEQPSRRRASKRSRRGLLARVVLAALLAGAAFLLGIAFARALEERPRTGDPATTVQTLAPRPQDVPQRTVTVTVTG
jgi:hypothetical protein